MKFDIKKIFNKYYGALTFLIVLASFLRIFYLGYSDYQGDEIKALFIPEAGQSIRDFLLTQRKGPMQFLITFVLKIVDQSYDNQFLVRIPFALAGVVSVFFFYKLVKEHFGNRIAFYASSFFVTNGFLIAFSRIVQYQSFVIVFMLASLYFMTITLSKQGYERKGIFLGFLFWSLSLLSHYDGVFITPFALYLLIRWWKNVSLSKKDKIKTLALSLSVSGILLVSFYIPFLLSLTGSTTDYWEGRLTGDVSGKISSSRYLFTVYQPIYSLHFYTILSLLGFLLIALSYLQRKQLVRKLISKLSIYTIHNKQALTALIVWFLFGFVVMEKVVYIPGTHIYVYLIPLFIIAAFGIYFSESIIKKILGSKIGTPIFIYGLILLFSFLYLQSAAVFVENKTEYPWKEEKFFFWTFPRPNPIFHLSMFGFPYYRNWEGIRDFVKTLNEPTIKAYSTNERKSIARYFINLEKSSDKAGIYVYIKNPQSFTNDILEEKPKYWTGKYEPVYTLSRDGQEIVSVYLMEPGSIEELQKMGY